MNFKRSFLFNDFCKLNEEGKLSDRAMDFLDACADDWKVTYSIEFQHDETEFTLETTRNGKFDGRRTSVTAIYKGDFAAMCSLVEHLALVKELLFEEWKKNFKEWEKNSTQRG